MKKMILAFMLMFGFTGLHATEFELPQIDLCAELGIGCPGPIGPEGPQGIPGIDGIDGINGEQGVKGDKGETGETGATGATGDTGPIGPQGETGASGTNGTDGAQGPAGVDGENGEDGIDGTNGVDGTNGIDGADGVDGKDGSDANVQAFLEDNNKMYEYMEDTAAGNMAVNAIDFGTTAKGITEMGIGIGGSHSYKGEAWAVGLGVKHGLTDNEAVILKGWVVDGDAYALGAAVTTRF